MDCLTAFGRLFVCLWAIGLSFRLFDYLPTIWLALWLYFGSLTVLWLSDCLSAFWLSFSYLTIFRQFDCLFGFLTVLSGTWLSSNYLTLFSAIWLSLGYLTVFSTVWLSSDNLTAPFGYLTLFDCLSAIWLSFRYLTVFWLLNCLLAILERH